LEQENLSDSKIQNDLIALIVDIRQQMKVEKNYAISDYVRTKLEELGINIKDTKDGAVWEIK